MSVNWKIGFYEGRPIKQVFWPETMAGEQPSIKAKGDTTLEWSSSADGGWICQKKNDVEVAIHNARFVESIFWGDLE